MTKNKRKEIEPIVKKGPGGRKPGGSRKEQDGSWRKWRAALTLPDTPVVEPIQPVGEEVATQISEKSDDSK